MRQRGVTFIELVICLGILGLLASRALLTIGETLAKQELDSAARQLVAEIRLLQQLSLNAGSGAVQTILHFNANEPCGYYVTANTEVTKRFTFPTSVRLPYPYMPIAFGLSGAPSGAQTIGLQSQKLGTWKYVILAPVTGRVRISDVSPLVTEE